jgi:hypothetical protein
MYLALLLFVVALFSKQTMNMAFHRVSFPPKVEDFKTKLGKEEEEGKQ